MRNKLVVKRPTGNKIQFISPMKARPFDEERSKDLNAMKDGGDFWAELKEDGQRILAHRETCWSGYGNEKSIEFLQDELPKNVLVDGEIVGIDPACRSEDVAHLLVHDQSKLKTVLFDVLYCDGWVLDEPLEQRRKILEGIVKGIKHQRIEIAKKIERNKEEFLNEILDQQREGIILKDRRSRYKPDSRSEAIKRKGTVTLDVVVVSADADPSEWRVRPGDKDKKGRIHPNGVRTSSWEKGYKNLVYGWYDTDGKLVTVGNLGVTGTPEKLAPRVGQVAEVKSFGRPYAGGNLRHPQVQRYRTADDKRPEDCVFCFKCGKPIEYIDEGKHEH